MFIIRQLTLLGLTTVFAGAATVQTFYNASDFQNAVRSGSFTTESFAGNQINTPGLSVSACYDPNYPTGGPSLCSPLSKAQLNAGTGYFQFITQNMFTDAVGRNPDNPYAVNFGTNDFSTLFTLPQSATALSFDVNEISNVGLGSNFGISLGSGILNYPFGGVEGPNGNFPGLPNNGYSYSGFVGFTSDTPFNTVDFSAFYDPGVSYTLDNLSFGDPTPEPSSVLLISAGVSFLIILRPRRTPQGKTS